MLKFVVKRLLMAIPVLLGVSIIVFCIMRVFSPDPAGVVLGDHATQDSINAWRDEYGLNKSLPEQYWDFLWGALHGDLGTSYYTHTSVTTEIMKRMPATIELALAAIVIAAVVGITLGTLAATHKGTAVDHVTMIVALAGVSMPVFWIGILFIILFAGTLHVLPSTGRIDPILQPSGGSGFYLVDTLAQGNLEAFGNVVSHLVLPSVALSLYSLAIIARMTRSSMLDALSEDYVRTAEAKGLRWGRVVRHHALRNAMLPVTTIIGLQLGGLMGGAMLTETVFAWPGVGKYTVDAIMKSDFPVVQGMCLLTGVIFIVMNLLVDVLYAYLDPRIKYAKEEG